MYAALACALIMPQQTQLPNPPAPLKPVPTAEQRAWHRLDMYAFIHFGPNTFTGNEWGTGKEKPGVFNPTKLDCKQWVKALKGAGMKGIIITAKHHDGFCLWPSKYSTHTVAQSPWKNGQGDVLQELSASCREGGLKFGVYLSPWDRNHPSYGTDDYNDVFVKTLQEVLTRYGDIFEVWFDGANGEGPNGRKQVYDFPRFIKTVRSCQPEAVIFSDAGPEVRWVGNEAGIASETNWATIDRDRYIPGTPHYKELGEGKEGGTHWVPAECDVSIRPGWFWRSSEDNKVKGGLELFKLYLKSAGRGANFLLNVPPNSDGLISEPDIRSLTSFSNILKAAFADNYAKNATYTASNVRGNEKVYTPFTPKGAGYWATDDNVTTATLDVELSEPRTFDLVALAEPVGLGQRIKAFKVSAFEKGALKEIGSGTTIGPRRILPVKPTTAQKIRIEITQTRACPALLPVGVYNSGLGKDLLPL